MKRRLRNSLALAVLAVSVWLCFDNVFSDDGPIRALAEKAACATHKCADPHGLTRESRTPFGQTLEYQWRDATVRVSCNRAYYVFGDRRCVVE